MDGELRSEAADVGESRQAAMKALEALGDWHVASFEQEAPSLLWSCGNRVTHYVAETFFRKHYVWCSPTFDASAIERYKTGYAQPPSSDPVSIYRDLLDGVRRRDEHHALVKRHKTTLRAVILDFFTARHLTPAAAREAISYLESTAITDWIPIIYVIPFGPVSDRVLSVPRKDRASWSPEYVIRDLQSTEFSVIEPMPCP